MKNLTDVATWSTPIEVPEDNIDLVNGDSVEPDSFQLLANRTAYLREFVDAQSPVSRTIRIPGIAMAGPAGHPAQSARDYVFVADTISSHAYADLTAYVPTGATVTKIEARVKPGAARSGTNRVTLVYYSGSGDSGGTFSSSFYDDGTTNAQTISTSTISLGVDRAKRQVLDLRAGSTANVDNDEFLWIDVTFTDPGARNY